MNGIIDKSCLKYARRDSNLRPRDYEYSVLSYTALVLLLTNHKKQNSPLLCSHTLVLQKWIVNKNNHHTILFQINLNKRIYMFQNGTNSRLRFNLIVQSISISVYLSVQQYLAWTTSQLPGLYPFCLISHAVCIDCASLALEGFFCMAAIA